MSTFVILADGWETNFFSDAFHKEFEKRLGEDVPYPSSNYRYHPVAIELLREKGWKWSSVSEYSRLRIFEVPAFIWKYVSIQTSGHEDTEYLTFDRNQAIVDSTCEALNNPTPEEIKALKELIHTLYTVVVQKEVLVKE